MDSLNSVRAACLIASLKNDAMVEFNSSTTAQDFPSLRVEVEHHVEDIALQFTV